MDRPYIVAVDWDRLESEERGRLRQHHYEARTCWYWRHGPGRDSTNTGDDSARLTADALMRRNGWTDEQLEWWAANFKGLPGPYRGKRRASKADFDAPQQRVDAWKLVRQWEEPRPAGEDEAAALCREIREQLQAVGGFKRPREGDSDWLPS